MRTALLGTLALCMALAATGAGAWDNNYNPGANPQITNVGNSTSASSWTLLNGTSQPQYDYKGDKVWTRAFRIMSDDGYNFFYAWTNSPTAYGYWRTDLWGPYENNMAPPTSVNGQPGGVYVATTFTSSGTSVFRVETKQ